MSIDESKERNAAYDAWARVSYEEAPDPIDAFVDGWLAHARASRPRENVERCAKVVEDMACPLAREGRPSDRYGFCGHARCGHFHEAADAIRASRPREAVITGDGSGNDGGNQVTPAQSAAGREGAVEKVVEAAKAYINAKGAPDRCASGIALGEAVNALLAAEAAGRGAS